MSPTDLLRALPTAPIRLYQRAISPLLGPRCRYYPSCSDYALRSIRSFGMLRGSILAGWRLLRCNPLSGGGFDYPEEQRLFARGRTASGTSDPKPRHPRIV